MASGNTVRDGSGDTWWHLIDALGRLRIYDDWTPSLQADEALNDSDKTLTVPADTQWRVKSIWVEFTSDATAADRQLVIEIQDAAADVISQTRAGVIQGASITRYYLFAPHVTELTAFRDTDFLSTVMPEWILPEGYIIRVWDNNVIAVAADDMIIQCQVESRPTS